MTGDTNFSIRFTMTILEHVAFLVVLAGTTDKEEQNLGGTTGMKALIARGRSGELSLGKCNTSVPLQSKQQGMLVCCRAEVVSSAASTSTPVSKFHYKSHAKGSPNALQCFDRIAGRLGLYDEIHQKDFKFRFLTK